jgi:hypothetical protein
MTLVTLLLQAVAVVVVELMKAQEEQVLVGI